MTTSFPYVRVEDIDGNLVHCQVAPLWDNWLKIAANRYKVFVSAHTHTKFKCIYTLLSVMPRLHRAATLS